MTKNNELLESDATKGIILLGELGSMCAHVAGIDPSKVTGPLKLALISNHLRPEDTKAWVNECPYIINIIVAGLNVSLKEFLRKQYSDEPYPVVELLSGLFEYEKLIRNDFNEMLEKSNAELQDAIDNNKVS